MHRIEVYRRLRVGIVRYWWGDSYRSCKWCISYVAQSHHLCHPIIFRPLGFDWSCFTGIWPPYNICICTISIITSNWSGRIATFLWSCVYQNLWISFISVDRSMGVPRQLPCTFIWRFGVHNTVGNTVGRRWLWTCWIRISGSWCWMHAVLVVDNASDDTKTMGHKSSWDFYTLKLTKKNQENTSLLVNSWSGPTATPFHEGSWVCKAWRLPCIKVQRKRETPVLIANRD